jgi:tetratricopeptide (TPR) repeat protein
VLVDPFEERNRLVDVAGERFFTDREDAIAAFERALATPAGEPVRVVVFYGVGGVGKSALLRRLLTALPGIPYAVVDLQAVGDRSRAYREVLLKLRTDLGQNFRLRFPRFDLCLAVMLAREGGDPPPLVKVNPVLGDAFKFISGLAMLVPGLWSLGVPLAESALRGSLKLFPGLQDMIRRAGGLDEIIRLRARVVQDDPSLPGDLVRRFAQDLGEQISERPGAACRAVLFLDTYETLWTGREAGGTAQARRLDWWIRDLARFCLHPRVGVLPVLFGRDRIGWEEENAEWSGLLEQHPLDGLSAGHAQTFLARCGVGRPQGEPSSALQDAIIRCCDTEPGPATRCHPLFLALCAEIALRSGGEKAPPSMFAGIPTPQLAAELSTRFLSSLHNQALQSWVIELSLTPRFDEQAALALDAARQYYNGRAGWEQLKRFSFIWQQPDGFWRLHKTMRDTLRVRAGATASAVHNWFLGHWTERSDAAAAWFHRWTLDPAGALEEWTAQHADALKDLRMTAARELLAKWADIALDDADRRVIGDALWATTHWKLGTALVDTPFAPRRDSLLSAIGHFEASLDVFEHGTQDWAATQVGIGNAYNQLPTGERTDNATRAIASYEAALRVYTEAAYPADWAAVQNNLASLFLDSPAGDLAENARRAIDCCEAALRVYTEQRHPTAWATVQVTLGNAYQNLWTGDRAEHLGRAIACYEAALRVRTRAAFPAEWAAVQTNLGNAHASLPTGDAGANLRRAIDCFDAALQVRHEANFPFERAMVQVYLANAYTRLPAGDRQGNLRRAIESYNAALRTCTEMDFPAQWAMIQLGLAIAYTNVLGEDREADLRRAIACCEAALRVFTRADYPALWAEVQTNLGAIYHALPDDHGENLRRAIACFESALEIHTEAALPISWALAQMNLGVAYVSFPDGDPAENLRRAIGYFDAALRVRTEAAFPAEWAAAQHDLGVAWGKMPGGDRLDSVRRSIGHLENALRVRTETAFPADWADTQRVLGAALAEEALITGDRSRTPEARERCLAAARGYRRLELHDKEAEVVEMLAQIDAALAAPPGDTASS